jgi:hypothetical protein
MRLSPSSTTSAPDPVKPMSAGLQPACSHERRARLAARQPPARRSRLQLRGCAVLRPLRAMKTQSTPPLAAVDQPRLVRLLLGSKDEWDFAPFGDFWVMTVSPVAAPNIIRRMMQRIIMGSRYRLIEDRPLRQSSFLSRTPLTTRRPRARVRRRFANEPPWCASLRGVAATVAETYRARPWRQAVL